MRELDYLSLRMLLNSLLWILLFNICWTEALSPNIVLVVLDDVGWADLSYSNFGSDFSTSIPTPRIDALSARGIRFMQHYTHPTCTPTRAALLTGRYSPFTGLTVAMMPGSTAGLPMNLPTLPQLLRALPQQPYETHRFSGMI